MSTQATLANKHWSPLGEEVHALLCWRCSAAIAELSTHAACEVADIACSRCGALTLCREGVWRCLSPERAQLYKRFVAEYEFIRAAEGRGSSDAAYYLALPYKDLSGKMSAQWKIRAQTFDFIRSRILVPRGRRQRRRLRILDLGAGNGWLSYRLALSGHAPTAVDLLTNRSDGLGAATSFAPHLPEMFPRVQAALDRLPFSSDTFDLAIFNASFHYSTDYSQTLAEALRCLCPGGAVIIADTPWYARDECGARMVEEKQAHFRARFGFPSNSIPSQEFLTPDRLEALAATLHLKWQTFAPFYGIAWSLRPLRARLKGRRPPSQFRIYLAERAS